MDKPKRTWAQDNSGLVQNKSAKEVILKREEIPIKRKKWLQNP